MKSIREAGDLKGVRVLVRASLNEPIEDGVLKGDFRLRKMLPVIAFLKEAGAKTILVGHLSGDPKTKTFKPIHDYFRKQFPLSFVEDFFSETGKEVLHSMENGGVVLLENIRRYPGEKENDPTFARKLANLADMYVNDNFSASHREHASLVGVPKLLPSYMGMQFEQEYTNLSKALNPPRPALVIVGGAKPKTKVPLIRQFLDHADTVFIGGISANEFFLAQGNSIGTSLSSGEDLGVAKFVAHSNVLLPKDVRVLQSDGKTITKEPTAVAPNDRIVDVGPDTLVELATTIADSAFVLWNGPLGDTDLGFAEGTEHLTRLIADSTATSIIGGGDTVASIMPLGIEDKVTFISTAGAAMIDFIVNGTLPGIKTLEESPIP